MSGISGTPAEAMVVYRGPANAATVSSFRAKVRLWLDEVADLDAERVHDIVLATDEALANCACHAYQDGQIGDMTLQLRHEPVKAEIQIWAVDRGCWRAPNVRSPKDAHGRGLVLMRALADDCVVDPQPDGTTVRLHFRQCPAQQRFDTTKP